VSDRREAQKGARRREEHFRTLAENLPDVIARLDRELRFLYVNRAAEALFGMRREEIVGRARGDVALPPALARVLTEAASCAFAGAA